MSALAVARLVRRELLRRPLHLALLLLSCGLVLLSRSMVSFGFGEESALVALSGLETIALYAFAVAVLFGAGAVGRDLDSRLLVSILARPIGRGAYLVGRFLGLLQTFALGAIPLTGLLVLTLHLIPAGPTGAPVDVPLGALLGGVVLALAQGAALAAGALAVSTLAPPAISLVLALLLGGAGLLAEPTRLALPAETSPLVHGLARLISLAMPPVSRPGEGAELAFGDGLPMGLLMTRVGWALAYAALALLVARWRLARKDLT